MTFQQAATEIMERIIDLHNDLMGIIVVIVVIVSGVIFVETREAHDETKRLPRVGFTANAANCAASITVSCPLSSTSLHLQSATPVHQSSFCRLIRHTPKKVDFFHQPRAVAQQVTLIHAGLSGALDKLPMDQIAATSDALLAELATSGLVVVDKNGQLNSENLAKVVKAALAF